ncbi:hypothetical protein [Streptomyces sp. NPDC056296]|uniref:hypothetical protein n=1 Tax=Streptomyces sp. NPDC056296 TaxID=3345775 RepID=UPI0035E1A7E3
MGPVRQVDGSKVAVVTTAGALVQARDRAASNWLLAAADNRDRAQRDWNDRGVALLRCGGAFTAIRVPASLITAAAGSEEHAWVSAYLSAALHRGPVFVDQTAGWYYCLVPSKARESWQEPETECFGDDHYLGVPCPGIDFQHPRARSCWVVPMDGPADLCSPDAISQLLDVARKKTAEAGAQ